METSLTVSGFPAPAAGQALNKYLREEEFHELSHAGTGVHRNPQGTAEQRLLPGLASGAR